VPTGPIPFCDPPFPAAEIRLLSPTRSCDVRKCKQVRNNTQLSLAAVADRNFAQPRTFAAHSQGVARGFDHCRDRDVVERRVIGALRRSHLRSCDEIAAELDEIPGRFRVRHIRWCAARLPPAAWE